MINKWQDHWRDVCNRIPSILAHRVLHKLFFFTKKRDHFNTAETMLTGVSTLLELPYFI